MAHSPKLPPTPRRPLIALASALFALTGLVGCGSDCIDDGFAWQQKTECQASATDSNSNSNSDSNSASATATDSASASATDSASASGTESDSASASASATATDSASATDSGTDTMPSSASATMTDSGGPSCMDGDQNGDETDVDCGGSCGMTCGTGQGCLVNDDCISNICDGGACQADPECENLMKDDPETDVDCGGVCGPTCQVGQVCIDAGDCASNYCNPDSMTCQVPACDDGITNGDETDLDCGGSCGMTCDNGQACVVDDDCISLVCDGGVCQASGLCDNGMKDMEETDVDCGGVCGPTCEIDEGCVIDGDCVSDYCQQQGKTCQTPACDDGVQNGDETDVDCGGSCETKCEIGEACLVPEDCVSMACGEGLCLAPECELAMDDNNCQACIKTNCCDGVIECLADPGCACWLECIEHNNDFMPCVDQCKSEGLKGKPGAITSCANSKCNTINACAI